MGTDKARLELGGRALIEYPLAALDEVASRVVLACGPTPRYAEWGRELALDALPGEGPLAGLLAGLEAARTPWAAVLACDLPRAEGRILARLLERARTAELDVCLLEVDRGTQPLVGAYRCSCAPAVRAALESGERRMVSFHPGLRVGSVHARELALESGTAFRPELNLNSPGELEAERRAPGRASAFRAGTSGAGACEAGGSGARR